MNSKHERYLREAEEQFSNASGDYGYYDEDMSMLGTDNPDVEAFAADGGYGDYMGGESEVGMYQATGQVPVKKIPDFDRTYTITVVNANGVTTNVTLFGANQFLIAVNFGNPAGITVTVGESSYVEMLQESQDSSFISSGMRLTSTNNAQLDQVMTVRKRTGNGQNCSYPIQVANYFSAFQFQAGIREIYPYHIQYAGTTSLSFPVLATTTVVLTLFVGKRIDTDNLLNNIPVREANKTALPFQNRQEVVLSGSAGRAIAESAGM